MEYLENCQREFATVDLLLQCQEQTGCTDAFILSWVKVEKQIRRVFTYTAFQFPALSKKDIISTVLKFKPTAGNYISGFNALSSTSFQHLIGNRYGKLWPQLEGIRKKYMNKILHGQLTGYALDSKTLCDQVEIMRGWVVLVAEKLTPEIGYDGLEPNSFRKANMARFSHLGFSMQIHSPQDLETFMKKYFGLSKVA